MKLKLFLGTTFIVIMLLNFSCTSPKKRLKKGKEVVYMDSTFNKKFEMYKPGFTGGDGTYSVLLPDGRTVWIFGDTFIGEVSKELTREKTSPMFIRNCFVIQQNDHEMKIMPQGEPNEFISMAIPDEVENGLKSEQEVWYWPGDGFVSNNTLNVFMSKFHQKNEGMWGFEFLETDLIQYSLPDMKEINKVNIPYSQVSDIHFGHSIFETKEYLYVYGLKEEKPYVSRTKYRSIASNWEFFDGIGWTSEIEKIKPMIDINGSEQFSIIKLISTYVLITQLGSFSKKVYSFTSNTPFGPWKNEQLLFETPIIYNNKDLFTYNAIAHPQFTKDNYLLISYNTNSLKIEDHFINAGIYRPRFMRVPISHILQ